MIENLTIRKTIIVLIGMIFTLTSCSTWHYKNSRVSVDVDRTSVAKQNTELQKEHATTSSTNEMGQIKIGSQNDDGAVLANASNITQVDVNKNRSTKSFFKTSFSLKRTIVNKNSFFETTKSSDHLLKVKDVEKTALSGWLRIMIILFAVGLLLLILGAILSIALGGGLWWLFYLIGSLCILAGAIVLLLGLLGIM